MNKKKVLLFSFAALLSGKELMAQTGNWKLAGNNLTGTEKLGSTNNQDVKFISNNVVNGLLSKTGFWGLGTTAPSAKLHINSATGQDALRVQINGATRLKITANGGVSIGGSASAPSDGLSVFGSAGIGTNTPSSKLHVLNGTGSGITPFFQSVISAENSDNAYINILSPSAHETGILFGNSESNVSGGIMYNSRFRSTPANALQFRTNGNEPRMVLTAEGDLGIGTMNPTTRLDLGDPGENGGILVAKSGLGTNVTFNKLNTSSTTPTLRVGNSGPANGIEASSSGNAIFAQTSNNSAFNAGFFDGDVFTTGSFNGSDEKLKQNIRDFNSAMSIINELRPKLYQYKKDGNYGLLHFPQGDHYGLIAQEVEKVLPNLVKNMKFDTRLAKPDAEREKSSPSDVIDFKALNYTELIPIIIKAVQELSEKNEELQKQIDGMKTASSSSAQNSKAISLTDASLEQNAPNPFASATSIRYTLPQKFTTAQIFITDKSGKTIKQLNISGTGKGVVNVEASALSAGTYSYSLVVDGKIISTKQMVVTK